MWFPTHIAVYRFEMRTRFGGPLNSRLTDALFFQRGSNAGCTFSSSGKVGEEEAGRGGR